MIKLGKFFDNLPGKSKLALYVCDRLPDDYDIYPEDLIWLDECDRFVEESLTNHSITEATKAALKANPRGHVDPFELLIDARICDTRCEPMP